MPDNVEPLNKEWGTIGDSLRELAAKADRNELKAYVIVWANEVTNVTTGWRNPSVYGHVLLSGVTMAQHELVRSMLEATERK